MDLDHANMTDNEYRMAWYHKKRGEYFADKCCAECGSTDRLYLLNLDPHKTNDDLRNIWSCKESIRQQLLANCTILCRDHWTRRRRPKEEEDRPHGDLRYALKSRCYCLWCGPVRKAYVRRWRQIRWKAKERGCKLPVVTPHPDHMPPGLDDDLARDLLEGQDVGQLVLPFADQQI